MTLDLVPNLIAASLVAGLAVSVTLRRPPTALWPTLLLYQIFALLYLAGDAITLVSQDMSWEQFGIAVLYSGSLPAAVCCWILTLRYAEVQGYPFSWARGPWIWAPVAITGLGWLVMFTNPWHGAFLVPVIGDHNVHLPLWYAVVPTGYVLVSGSVLLLGALAFRATERDVRRNAIIMAAGILMTIALNVVSYLPSFRGPFDYSVVGVGATGALFLFGAYRTRLFDLLPVALHQVVRHATEGIILLDTDGRWLYSNPAAESMVGVRDDAPNQDVVGMLRARLLDADGRTLERSALMAALLPTPPRDTLESGGEARRLGPLQLPDGRWMYVTATGIPDRRGRSLVSALRLNDVTELREATERLRMEEETRRLTDRLEHERRLEGLGSLAAGIAHDFNNLLLVIVGNAGLGLEELASRQDLRHRLERIKAAGDFAIELTDQILIAAGKRSLEIAVLDLSQLAVELLDGLRASSSPKCHIELDLDHGLGAIRGDGNQLRQLVSNLVRNSAQALEESGGHIQIATTRQHVDAETLRSSRGAPDLRAGEYAVLEVLDNGPGIEPKLWSRVFEPFFSTRDEARGLGLAAVHGIARSHGAALLLDDGPDGGCRVRVLLPFAGEATANQGAKGVRDASHGCVLVVDDDLAVLELATAYLERAGFRVLSSPGGAEALQLFDGGKEEIRAVVLDLGMPGLDGWQTLGELHSRSAEVGVVLVSGYGKELARERFGADAEIFLAKPYESEDLIEAVSRVITR